MYISQSISSEGRRCGRSSSVWSVGESSSVLYMSVGDSLRDDAPLRCDASISMEPVTLGGRRRRGGLSATAAAQGYGIHGDGRLAAERRVVAQGVADGHI